MQQLHETIRWARICDAHIPQIADALTKIADKLSASPTAKLQDQKDEAVMMMDYYRKRSGRFKDALDTIANAVFIHGNHAQEIARRAIDEQANAADAVLRELNTKKSPDEQRKEIGDQVVAAASKALQGAIRKQEPDEKRRKEIVALAQGMFESPEASEIDDDAVVSEGDDNGAYVQSWTWVDFSGTPLDKENKPCQS